jgi:hypothetical protein
VLRLAMLSSGLPMEPQRQCSMGMAIFHRYGAVAWDASAREASLIAPTVSGETGAVAIADVGRNKVYAIIALRCYAVVDLDSQELQIKIEQVDDA